MRQWVRTLGRFVVPMSTLLLLGPALAAATPREEKVRGHLGALSFPFVANQGQVDAEVAYYARTFAGTVFVTQKGQLVYALPKRTGGAPRGVQEGPLAPGWTLTETLQGAKLRPTAQDRGVTGVSYFLGSDPARWRDREPSYEQVNLGEAWPGITVSLRARGDNVEKVFTVSPGASVARIRVRVGGAHSLAVDRDGALIANTGLGPVAFTAPIAYQEVDGERRPVAVAYRLDEHEYRFTVGAYDRTRSLIIDPLLQSTYLGGNGSDFVRALAIHPTTGDVYVAGFTLSSNFPGTAGGAQPVFSGDSPGANADAFVARLNADLTTLIQATYLGGTERDFAYTLAVHPTTGDVYVGGSTNSTDFPGTLGGAQPTMTAGASGVFDPGDAFVARLDFSLTALIQATYLGGTGDDDVYALAIHPTTGDAYVAGSTSSRDFPGTGGGAQSVYGGKSPFETVLPVPGPGDAFVARLNSGLTALAQATYLGGSFGDIARAIALAPATGDVYVAGETESGNFPGTLGGAQPVYSGTAGQGNNAFVARLSSSLTVLTQSTFYGGRSMRTYGLVIHPATGDIYIAGGTQSVDLPGTIGGAQPTAAGFGGDAFVAQFSSDLTALLQATYLGGHDHTDSVYALAVHPATGDVYVAGATAATDFPGTAGGVQQANGGFLDAFVARLSSDLTALLQATYLGSSGAQIAYSLAIHPTLGDIYVAGDTDGGSFPGASGGAQPVGSGAEGFVSRLTASLTLMDPGNLCCHDVSGGGHAAILWRDVASGRVAVWLMNGTSLGASGTPGGAGSDWQIVGVADFNGDGMADILWRHVVSGAVTTWWLNGTSVSGGVALGAATPDWAIVGVGDFDNDGRADILWRHTSGIVHVWLIDETGIANSRVGSIGSDWHILGVGDFNGDGLADILWRHRSGLVSVWLMNGPRAIGIIGPGWPSMDWRIVGVSDFNGDGTADILWRDGSGLVAVWLMSGTGLIGGGAIGQAGGDWQIVGVGDFNGDGRADILWRHTSGLVSQWLIDGTRIIGTGSPGAVTDDWQIP